ncbi:MAG: NAD(P)H-dependent oxidoreductase [Fimbriimonadaceae bacterium]
MSNMKNVAVILGSIRKDSNTQAIARALSELAPTTLKLNVVTIGNLPLYNPDLDGSEPAEWLELRSTIKAADAVLFITPEHNRSFPAALKNALDIASRPYGSSAWDGKPGAVISHSPGMTGGFGANHHLRQCLAYLNVLTVQQPEVYLGSIGGSIADGNVTNPSTREFLGKFMVAFETWIKKLSD